jgi:hypothetical protein
MAQALDLLNRANWAVVGPILAFSAIVFLLVWAYSHRGGKKFDEVARRDLAKWRFIRYGPRNSRTSVRPAFVFSLLVLLLLFLAVPLFFPQYPVLRPR